METIPFSIPIFILSVFFFGFWFLVVLFFTGDIAPNGGKNRAGGVHKASKDSRRQAQRCNFSHVVGNGRRQAAVLNSHFNGNRSAVLL